MGALEVPRNVPLWRASTGTTAARGTDSGRSGTGPSKDAGPPLRSFPPPPPPLLFVCLRSGGWVSSARFPLACCLLLPACSVRGRVWGTLLPGALRVPGGGASFSRPQPFFAQSSGVVFSRASLMSGCVALAQRPPFLSPRLCWVVGGKSLWSPSGAPSPVAGVCSFLCLPLCLRAASPRARLRCVRERKGLPELGVSPLHGKQVASGEGTSAIHDPTGK